MSLTPEQIRQQQVIDARTMERTEALTSIHPFTIGVTESGRGAVSASGIGIDRIKPATRPKVAGHDAILKAMQENSQKATIITSGGGDKYRGTIVGRDKFTITMLTDHPDGLAKKIRRVFYKSAIEQFWGEEVPRVRAVDVLAEAGQ
jgi:hypothetical protein